MIRFESFGYTYPGAGTPALKSISLEIPPGDFVGIIGPSGAGKSTLTYAVNGAIPHHYGGSCQGRVLVDGCDVFDTPPEALALKVGSLIGDVENFFVSSMVEEELLFGLENFNIPRDEIESRIAEALEAVGIPHLRHRHIASLSGGQKQKVALAAVLSLRPRILLLDEPTSELDPQSSRQIFALLRRLSESQGITVVAVEQKIMLLCEYVRRLAVMSEGEICCFGPVREVLADPARLEALGVNCPRVVTLAARLAADGLPTGPMPINVPEAETMIRRMLRDHL